MPPPMCIEAPYQLDNHHENGDSRYFVGYKWTVPEDLAHTSCSIRIRYYITSTDYNAWNIGNNATEYNRRNVSNEKNCRIGCTSSKSHQIFLFDFVITERKLLADDH